MPDSGPLPAAVAAAFDRDRIAPVIVEGVADRETGRLVQANDPVRIASISKLVMALAALRLAEEGKVDLDADVSRYLSWEVRHPGFPDVPITLRDILTHRAGLRDDAGYVIPLGHSLQVKLAEHEAWDAEARPGTASFEYANLGSPVAATVLEAASGERYDRLVERTVFDPLGIEGCLNWLGCAREQANRAVVLYRSTGEVARDDEADRPPHCTFPVAEGASCLLDDYVPGTNASIFSPQGGVRMGMIDLAKLGQAIARQDRSLLSKAGWDWLMQSVALGATEDQDFFCAYGLGIQRIEAAAAPCEDGLFGDSTPRIGHAGEAYGLRSGLWLDPLTGDGLAYFVTSVPDRSAPDEGGFVPEELALVRRAMENLRSMQQ